MRREREKFSINGHHMEIIPEYEMGGGYSGLNLYCWSCSPTGSHILMRCDLWDYKDGHKIFTEHEADYVLGKVMLEHSDWKE